MRLVKPAWVSGISLDMKLGSRMLVKYPGFTIVGGVAMAFAIWIGAMVFEGVALFTSPRIPLTDGDRLVYLQNWDASKSGAEARSLYDFQVWRDQLRSVVDLGAYRDVPRNLGSSENDVREVGVAEMTSSGFKVADVRPLLGRVLTAADERPGAPPVAVVGYDLWQERFAGDGTIVGQSVRIGDAFATIVGVMPKGFAFPVSHELWMPLHIEQFDRAPRAGPAIKVFGRLADGATLEQAQRELRLIGQRMARDFAPTHEHLQPRVDKYAHQAFDPSNQDPVFIYAMNVFAIALLGLICGNVALLLFARATTRETELIVRSALGASRGRIIMQLFAEALVLGGVAAVVGLGVAALSLNRWGRQYLEVNFGTMPFWYDVHLSLPTIVYAIGLTILAAVIAGVLPALKVTRAISDKLRQGTAGSGLRFGGVWTAVIVAQVAATVVFPAIVSVVRNEAVRIENGDVGFAAAEYLSVRVDVDATTNTDSPSAADRDALRARIGSTIEALRQRLIAEPGVRGVTYVDRLPRLGHREVAYKLLDAEDITSTTPEIALAAIDPSYFAALEAPILAGRAFHAGDLAPGANTVIVDQGFVDQVLNGRSAVGRQLRIGEGREIPDTGAVFQIVGVVKELGMSDFNSKDRAAGVYLPLPPGARPSVFMLVHATQDPLALTPRLRNIASVIDPNLRLNEIMVMDRLLDEPLWFLHLWRNATAILTGIALLLSLAGIYAVLSFTVARRTREIGVRVALGASRERVVAAIFRRPLAQVGAGIALGTLLVGVGGYILTNHVPDGGTPAQGSSVSIGQMAMLLAYALLMMGVCMLACIVPTRRALGVQPTEALRAE